MVRTLLGLVVVGVVVSGGTRVSGDTVFKSALHDYRLVPFVEALVQPWSIAFLPGGDVLITERPGRLRIVRNGKLLPQAVEGVPQVVFASQGGLLEVMPHPNFASNRMLYLTYSKNKADGTGPTTALVRGRFENDRLTGVQQLFESVSHRPRTLRRQDRVRQERLPVSHARRSTGSARRQARSAPGAGSVEPSRQDDPAA